MSSDTDHGVEEVLVVPYVRNREEGRTSRPTTSSESDIDVYCLKESVPYTRDRHERSPATTSSDSETEVESLPYGRDRSLLMPEAPSGFKRWGLLTPTHEKAKIQKKERRRSKNS